ncbi:DUF2798 domain-containing protein [Parathalassolituus penaei]|uniref:DUF2798 domain-containing protein n=1 Tax=Parathalassolituus penaei TaxID=2997323 RepID=UPI003204D3AE
MSIKFRIINSLIMSGVLSLLMTCWITFINLGSGPDFPQLWMHAWSLAWPPAFMIAFSFGPMVMRLSHKLARTGK